MLPGLQVSNGLGGQVLFIKLFVDLGQLGQPEAVGVLGQDLLDAVLDLLRVVDFAFATVQILIQV